MHPSQLTISSRFNGPPHSGNGGYVCGIIGKYIDGPAEVMLRVPPPLDKLLEVREDGDKLLLMDGDVMIGEGAALDFEMELPAPVSFDEASDASDHYIAKEEHHFHTCFVCGPSRGVDGLRIFAGREEDASDVVAAPWIPTDDLFGEDDILQEEYYWAAMDCPSYFALLEDKMYPMLLGKMAARIVNPIRRDEKIVVMAQKIKSEGRKHYSMSVLYGEDSSLKGYSRNLWFSLGEEKMKALGL